MTSPLLTIITVTINCASTLERTLVSVRAIKNASMEYVIVDGVSTDGTLELARRYDDLVDKIVSEPDTGIYNAMNKGVALAKGKYILFINGDDELIADDFPEAVKAMQAGANDIVCATTLVGKAASPSEILTAAPWRLPFYNSVPHPSSFVLTSLLRKFPFDEELKIAADYDFFLRAYLGRHRFKIVSAATALHQRGGASGDTQRSHEEIDRVRRKRLGLYYPITNWIGATYRTLKSLIVRTRK